MSEIDAAAGLVVRDTDHRRPPPADPGTLVQTGCRDCSPRRTPHCGGRTPRPRRPCGWAGWTLTRRSRDLVPVLAERCARTGRPGPRRARRHGRLLARPRGRSPATAGRAADRARHHRPRPGPLGAWPTGSRTVSWWSPASPAPLWRPTASGARSGRRSPTPGSPTAAGIRDRHRSRLAAGGDRAARGRTTSYWPTRTWAAATAALTAFGLVPSALAGVDVAELLDEADALARSLGRRPGQPGAGPRRRPRRGRAGRSGQGRAHRRRHRHHRAAATGPSSSSPSPPASRAWASCRSSWSRRRARLERRPRLTVDHGWLARRRDRCPAAGEPARRGQRAPRGQFLVWESAVAIAGRVLGINPFDQPDVTESKPNTRPARCRRDGRAGAARLSRARSRCTPTTWTVPPTAGRRARAG